MNDEVLFYIFFVFVDYIIIIINYNYYFEKYHKKQRYFTHHNIIDINNNINDIDIKVNSVRFVAQ